MKDLHNENYQLDNENYCQETQDKTLTDRKNPIFVEGRVKIALMSILPKAITDLMKFQLKNSSDFFKKEME